MPAFFTSLFQNRFIYCLIYTTICLGLLCFYDEMFSFNLIAN